MDEKEECKEKVFLDLIEIGQIYQDMNDPDAQAVLIFGGRAYCIDIRLLTNRLLKYDTETLDITEMRRY
jgi:hypothetical protein